MKSGAALSLTLHVPLRRLALCLDCERTFAIGPASCPACSSRTWITLARFLQSAERLTGVTATTGEGCHSL